MENENNNLESLVTMVNSVDEGNPSQFSTVFKNELFARIGKAIETEKTKIAQSYGDRSEDPLNDDVSFDDSATESQDDSGNNE